MTDEQPSRKLIIPKGVLESGNNIIEIPEACEDSRVLIAKLQAQQNRPPGYYPPKTNPDNKFERHIGNVCVGLGMPPLSPVREEYSGYEPSFGQYGGQQDSSYYGEVSRDTSSRSPCPPCSTPYGRMPSPAPSSRGQRSAAAAASSSPPCSDKSLSFGDMSQMLDRSPSPAPQRYMPPPPPSRQATFQDRGPRRGGAPCNVTDPSLSLNDVSQMLDRTPSPRRQPARAPPRNVTDPSLSFGDVSQMMSPSTPAASRSANRPAPRAAPSLRRQPVIRGPHGGAGRPPRLGCASDSPSLSFGEISAMMSPPSPRRPPPQPQPQPQAGYDSSKSLSSKDISDMLDTPDELDNSALNHSLEELELVELDEVRVVQERMRRFQEARRDLVVSILSLHETDVVA